MAREVLGAAGAAPGEGGTLRLFLQANEFKPENLAGSVSRVFLGVSLDAAQDGVSSDADISGAGTVRVLVVTAREDI